jgi:hypothetical protein
MMMATAEQQARFRAKDSKALIQVRLSHEAVNRLDALVEAKGASGRASVIEGLLAESELDGVSAREVMDSSREMIGELMDVVGRLTEELARRSM